MHDCNVFTSILFLVYELESYALLPIHANTTRTRRNTITCTYSDSSMYKLILVDITLSEFLREEEFEDYSSYTSSHLLTVDF